eukprot:Tbor_TRINITY_DN1709_c0_g1::TRINITY_DN1709_c0_g1_i1::g.21342::m.21342/K10134/EI24; etoposide-induced 2.4 mRNA
MCIREIGLSSSSSPSESSRRGNSDRKQSVSSFLNQEALVGIVSGFKSGVCDSVSFIRFTQYCARNSSIRASFFQNCLALNAILFVGLWYFTSIIQPSTSAMGEVLQWLFKFLWVIPMYIITYVLGLLRYERLYDLCRTEKYRLAKKNPPPRRGTDFMTVTESLFKLLMCIIYYIVTVLVSFIPALEIGIPFNHSCIRIPIGFFMYCFMSSLLHSFYCFDYKLMDKDIVDRATKKFVHPNVSQVIWAFERKWPYFLGYGSTHIAFRVAMESAAFDPLLCRVLCSILFAVNMATTVDANMTYTNYSLAPSLPVMMPFFTVTNNLIVAVYKIFFKKVKK